MITALLFLVFGFLTYLQFGIVGVFAFGMTFLIFFVLGKSGIFND